jgi:hypothetical protein
MQSEYFIDAMLRLYKGLVIYCFTALLLIPCNVLAQSAADLKLQERKKFIGKVEVFGSVAQSFPNDKSWGDFLFKSTNGQTIYESKGRMGYTLGISLIHSIVKKFEVQSKFSFDRKKYFERYMTLDNQGNPYSESVSDQMNNYISFSLVPTYFFAKPERLHLFAGLSYSCLTNSLEFGKNYINGQYVGSASINTINGFEKYVLDALGGIGYLLPLNGKVEWAVRIQGNYGLSNWDMQNNYKLRVNSLSLSLIIRYTR